MQHYTRLESCTLVALIAIIAFCGLACFLSNGFASRFSDKFLSYVTYQFEFKAAGRVGSCWISAVAPPSAFAEDCVDSAPVDKPLILVWGDSHAASFLSGLRAAIKDNFRLAQLTRDSCPPVLNYGYENCIASNASIFSNIETLRPDIVILFAAWNRYQGTSGKRYPLDDLSVTLKKLDEQGVAKIIVIGPAPQWGDSMRNNLVRQAARMGSNSIEQRTYLKFDSAARQVDSLLKASIVPTTNLKFFSALDALCDTAGCMTTVNGRADGLTTWDYGHLTTSGAKYLAHKMIETTGYFGEASGEVLNGILAPKALTNGATQ